MTLIEFLEARIAEDAEVARYAVGRTRALAECEAKRRLIVNALARDFLGCAHLTSERVSGVCKCNRDEASDTLRILTVPYADHPDMRDEWQADNPDFQNPDTRDEWKP